MMMSITRVVHRRRSRDVAESVIGNSRKRATAAGRLPRGNAAPLRRVAASQET